jgi:hypothetical protein
VPRPVRVPVLGAGDPQRPLLGVGRVETPYAPMNQPATRTLGAVLYGTPGTGSLRMLPDQAWSRRDGLPGIL